MKLTCLSELGTIIEGGVPVLAYHVLAVGYFSRLSVEPGTPSTLGMCATEHDSVIGLG